ncbi:hypothetical protein MJO29_015276 [Puccinia striiformis f. sp. tritici]|nr:hypothetical protein MJO29_015276 [Puccinia striiformis f. sp. tritici]
MKSSIHNSTTSPPEGTNDSVPAEDRSTPEPIESDTNDKNHNPSGKRALGDASTEESTSGSESTNEASEVELESWLSLSTLPTQPELLNPVGNDAQGTSTTSNNHDRPTHHEISLWFAGLWNYNKQSYTQTEKKFIHLEEKEQNSEHQASEDQLEAFSRNSYLYHQLISLNQKIAKINHDLSKGAKETGVYSHISEHHDNQLQKKLRSLGVEPVSNL